MASATDTMASVTQLTEDEKQLMMHLTQSPDEETAQIAAVREYLKYMKRMELLQAAGTIDFDMSRIPSVEAEDWPMIPGLKVPQL